MKSHLVWWDPHLTGETPEWPNEILDFPSWNHYFYGEITTFMVKSLLFKVKPPYFSWWNHSESPINSPSNGWRFHSASNLFCICILVREGQRWYTGHVIVELNLSRLWEPRDEEENHRNNGGFPWDFPWMFYPLVITNRLRTWTWIVDFPCL